MSRSSRLLAHVVPALLVGTTLAGCGNANATGDKGYVAGDGVITVLPVAKRQAPTGVAGKTLQGKRVSLGDFAGKPVVVNVWGSWCAPCRAESSTLTGAATSLGSRAAFLGINVRDAGGTDQSLAFERRFHVTYPSIYDPAARTLLGFHGKVTLASIPSTVVVDSRGRIGAVITGPVPSARTLVDLVSDVQKGVT
jgi:thiol-disulfide isomerase/thioredoxin